MVNSLATLQTLIDQGDQQAPMIVLKLAQFLNYVLYESGVDQVPLDRDLQAMQAYIALEKERLGDQIDISLTITGQVAGQVIAPLLWLPLLENVFHHSQTTADQAWLNLNLSVTEKIPADQPLWSADTVDARFPRYAGAAGTFRPAQLKLSLANNAERTEGTELLPGNGLKTVRKRLDTHYPNRYELKLVAEPSVYLVVLTLQLDAASDAVTSRSYLTNA